jgi:hypothetical protein
MERPVSIAPEARRLASVVALVGLFASSACGFLEGHETTDFCDGKESVNCFQCPTEEHDCVRGICAWDDDCAVNYCATEPVDDGTPCRQESIDSWGHVEGECRSGLCSPCTNGQCSSWDYEDVCAECLENYETKDASE